jgi:hypothetical protein
MKKVIAPSQQKYAVQDGSRKTVVMAKYLLNAHSTPQDQF